MNYNYRKTVFFVFYESPTNRALGYLESVIPTTRAFKCYVSFILELSACELNVCNLSLAKFFCDSYAIQTFLSVY